MDRIGKKAGITPFSTSAQKLRHTVNVIARRAGLDQYTRSALLGHASEEALRRQPGSAAGVDPFPLWSRRPADSVSRVWLPTPLSSGTFVRARFRAGDIPHEVS
jgi:hypothetical protein